MSDLARFLRQVHPMMAPGGEPSSAAFRPTPKDEGNLSGYDHQMISPEGAFRHFTEQLGLQSVGVYGLSEGEVAQALADEIARRRANPAGVTSPDPTLLLMSSPTSDNLYHMHLRFEGWTPKATERVSKQLRNYAVVRRRMHP